MKEVVSGLIRRISCPLNDGGQKQSPEKRMGGARPIIIAVHGIGGGSPRLSSSQNVRSSSDRETTISQETRLSAH